MKERIHHYYIEQDMNCAESILHVLNDQYSLGLSETDFKLVSGFGGGCGCGKLCGALAGCVAALGCRMVTDRAHNTLGFREACAAPPSWNPPQNASARSQKVTKNTVFLLNMRRRFRQS